MRLVRPTPVMVVVPEHDVISPPADQLGLFERVGSTPKTLHIARGKGDLNVLSGDDAPALQQLQVDFLSGALDGSLAASMSTDVEGATARAVTLSDVRSACGWRVAGGAGPV